MSGSSSSDAAEAQAPASSAHAAGDSAGDRPLELTVHSLPDSAPDDEARSRTRIGRIKMLLVLLVCATPVIASYFTYYVIRPEGRRNFGELIEPQRPVPALVARSEQGQPVALSTLKGQWLLVVVAGGACDTLCEQQLYLQRQLREMTGKEKDRVDRVWLIPDGVSPREAIRPGLQGATVLQLPREDLARWLQPAAGSRLEDHLYVVDPMGNWMMRLPAGLGRETASRARRDLERLLRASAFWDQPGR